MGLVLNIYKKKIITRYDKQEHIRYFTHRDFEGLNKLDISFKSEQNNTLKGGLYYYEGYDEKTLVIFCHGIGCGHLSYMREIELLCKNGFMVLSYDNTGCDSSEGESIRGLSQSVSDLNSCLNYVRANEELKNKTVYVMGHSWGGYAAGNILNFRNDIDRVVILSGFVSVDKMLDQYLKGILNSLKNIVLKYERKMNPKYADCSMDKGLNKGKVEALIIQSEDDPIVNFSSGIGYLKDTVKSQSVDYFAASNKKHNPNYTFDAVNYFLESFGALEAAIKNGKVKTVEDKKEFFKDIDWYRMTEQDNEIWDMIIEFLKD